MDYTKEDFSDSGVKYDLILGVNGYNPIAKYLEALAEYGRYVLIGGTGKQLMEGMVKASFMKKGTKKLIGMGSANSDKNDLTIIKGLYEEGKLVTKIDKVYELKETKEAFKYAMEGHPIGKVMVKVL